MLQRKTLRRRCDLPACGKLYRHFNPRSRTCSSIMPAEALSGAQKGC